MSDGLCFVCHDPIAANDASFRSIQFVGDAQAEGGRYATHMGCSTGLRHQWLTRNADGYLVPANPRGRVPWRWRVQRWLARGLASVAAKFEPPRRFQ